MGQTRLDRRIFLVLLPVALLLPCCAVRQVTDNAPVVRVIDFGARCDGTGDDTRAIQQALEAAASPPGQTVRLPPGTCVLATAAAEGAMLQVHSFTRVRGAGMGKTILRVADGWQGPRETNVIYTDLGGVDVLIEDLTIDFNAQGNPDKFAPTGLYGIAVRSSRTVVRRVEVQNSPANGMGVPTTGSAVRFESCVAHDNRINGFYAGAVVGLDIVNSEAWANTNGIGLGNGTRKIVIAGNVLRDQRADGISVGDTEAQSHRTDTRELVIAGNRIHDNARAGIGLIASRNQGASPSLDAVVFDNELARNGEVGISCNSAQDIVIADNELRDTGGPAILVLNGRGITIHRNSIVGGRRDAIRAGRAIRIADNPDGPNSLGSGRISVVDNRIDLPLAGRAGVRAISIDTRALSDRVVIAHNRLADATGDERTVDPRVVWVGNGP